MGWTIALTVGMLLMLAGISLAWREHLWLKEATVVKGTVIELVISRGSKGATYCPKVQFQAKDKSWHEFIRGYSSSPPEFHTGDAVLVAYHDAGYEGRILTFGQRFGFFAGMMVVGLSLVLMYAAFYFGQQLVPAIYESADAEMLPRVTVR